MQISQITNSNKPSEQTWNTKGLRPGNNFTKSNSTGKYRNRPEIRRDCDQFLPFSLGILYLTIGTDLKYEGIATQVQVEIKSLKRLHQIGTDLKYEGIATRYCIIGIMQSSFFIGTDLKYEGIATKVYDWIPLLLLSSEQTWNTKGLRHIAACSNLPSDIYIGTDLKYEGIATYSVKLYSTLWYSSEQTWNTKGLRQGYPDICLTPDLPNRNRPEIRRDCDVRCFCSFLVSIFFIGTDLKYEGIAT